MEMTMNKYIEEMINVLDNKLGYANTILLVLEGSVPRFSNFLYAMFRQMTSIFGETWWDFMMIGVSKWKYSQSAIDERQDACDYYGDPSDRCKNEAWFIRELSQQLQRDDVVVAVQPIQLPLLRLQRRRRGVQQSRLDLLPRVVS